MKTWRGAAVAAIALVSLGSFEARAGTTEVRETERLFACATWVPSGPADPATRVDGDRYVEDRLCVWGDTDRIAGSDAGDMSSDGAERTHSTCTWHEGDQPGGHYEYAQCDSTYANGNVPAGTIRASDEDERRIVVRGLALGCPVDLTFGPRLGGDDPEPDPTHVEPRSRTWNEYGAAPVSGRACDVDITPLSPRGDISWQHSDTEVAAP